MFSQLIENPMWICLMFFNLMAKTQNIIKINDYKLIQMEPPFNTKRGGICIHYKEWLVLKIINISCLLCEVMIANIREYIAFIYRSSIQNSFKIMVEFQHQNTWRYSNWCLNYIIWLATISKWTNQSHSFWRFPLSSISYIDLIEFLENWKFW